MSPIRLTISAEDALRGKKVKPGWYRSKVVDVKEELNKAKDAMNIILDIVGTEGDANGVPLRHYISEKAAVFAIPVLEAFGVKVNETTGETVTFDGLKGRDVRIKWNYDAENKRNIAEDWAPAPSGLPVDVKGAVAAPGEFA